MNGLYLDNREVDDLESIKKNVKKIGNLIKKCRYCVLYTGAGLSMATRDPYLFRTKVFSGRKTSSWRNPEKPKKFELPNIHKNIYDLYERCFFQFIVTINTSGDHIKSGIHKNKVAELLGNRYKEICTKCGNEFLRENPIRMILRRQQALEESENSEESRFNVLYGRHYHGRKCEDCGGCLIDTVVHFGEDFPKDKMVEAERHFKKCDLSIVMGTSLLKDFPSSNLPFTRKKIQKNDNTKVVYINHADNSSLISEENRNLIDIWVFGRLEKTIELLITELAGIERKKIIPDNEDEFLTEKLEFILSEESLKKTYFENTDFKMFEISLSNSTCIKMFKWIIM